MKKFLTFLVICLFSIVIPTGFSDEVGITDGMYIKHTYTYSRNPGEESVFSSTIEYSKTSNDFYHVIWTVQGSSIYTGYWDVDINTRIVSNMLSPAPDDNSHDFSWIFTNVSLNDQFMMFNFFSLNDHEFNISGESMYGSMEVWELKDNHGSVCWFDKTKGFFVNGILRYNLSWQKFDFVEQGPLDNPGIPLYIIILSTGGLGFTGILAWIGFNRFKLYKKRKIKGINKE